jgi:hypothetical protein
VNLFVVVDTKGSGRIVGVFDAREEAERVADCGRAYYKVHPCPLNVINPEVLSWADSEEQRDALHQLMNRR